MKKNFAATILLLLVLASSISIFAQKWTAGYRTGASQDNFQFNDQFAQGGNLIWNNQVFIDRRIGKHWEIELNASYGVLKSSNSYSLFNEPTIVAHTSWSTKTLGIGAYARYYFYKKNLWETFGLAGIAASNSWSDYKTNYSGTPANTQNYPPEGKMDYGWSAISTLSLGAGANYALSDHLQLSGIAQLSYKANGKPWYGSTVNQNNFSPAFFVGIGYRF